MTVTDLKNIRQLAAKEPRTKTGLVRMLWPEIKQALDAGHSIKEICLALNGDGIEIKYSSLYYCIGLLKRKMVTEMEQPRRQHSQAPSDLRPVNPIDPAAALKAQRAKKIKFDHDPFSTRIKDLV